ncbi:hypothetical protein [Neoroseomonas oryzicola]|nr:hypothetical protein [Neoroseomonas oryzicola]NKE17432.1 hypothetical protein [Neoroseomonas oryzicola]
MAAGTIPLPNRKSIQSWPSARLLELAEAHVGDRDLLEFIQVELKRRDVEVAHAAAQRVADLLSRGVAPAAAAAPADDEDEDALAQRDLRIGALKARIEALEQRVRESEMRATAAERALSMESLPARGGGLLRRVHLADTAPAWLIDAARRAFRLRFHPDRFADPLMKSRAEETFKEAEEVFRQISGGS